MGKGGQIWLKCIAGDLIMVIRDKNNIFERVENFHADLAWNYPIFGFVDHFHFSMTIFCFPNSANTCGDMDFFGPTD